MNLHCDDSKKVVAIEVWAGASKRLPATMLSQASILDDHGVDRTGSVIPVQIKLNEKEIADVCLGETGTAVTSRYSGRWLPKGVTLCFSEDQRLIGLEIRDWRRKLPHGVLAEAGLVG
jgi:hypothetical protein